jgi:hypothetical protein
VTLDPQQWQILERIADVARQSDRDTFVTEYQRRDLLRTERRPFIELIEELLAANQYFADVALSVGSLLRSRIAADDVADAYATEPNTVDDVEDAFTPDDVLRIARVRGQAEAAILRERMFDGAKVAKTLGSQAANPREFARSLRARGEALALPFGNRFVFPAFQFDEGRKRVRPMVAQVNRLLGALDDPWGVASFWFSRDPHLDARPADLAISDQQSEDVLGAARRELAPIG